MELDLQKSVQGPLSYTKSGVVILIENLGNHIELTGSVAVTGSFTVDGEFRNKIKKLYEK